MGVGHGNLLSYKQVVEHLGKQCTLSSFVFFFCVPILVPLRECMPTFFLFYFTTYSVPQLKMDKIINLTS